MPAQPNSPQQQERVNRILRAAARQGAAHGLERVQMQEIAKESGVAIATLYRYFPSKMHLFTGVMRMQIGRIGAEVSQPADGTDPVDAVTDLMLAATKRMLDSPKLAHAMMTSNNAAFHATEAGAHETHLAFKGLILRAARIAEPTPRDEQLVRLIEQSWFGALNSALNGRTTREESEDDIRLSCRLLLPAWSER
nr:TetR family transcriptional regulator [Nocardioides daedukensis]